MSLEMYVEWEGIEEVNNKLHQFDASLKVHVQENLKDLAYSMENAAKQLAPVKTGYLRSTIYAEIHDWSFEVGSTAPYAAFLEFGTRRIRPCRFLKRAIETHLSKLGKALDDAVDAAVAGVART